MRELAVFLALVALAAVRASAADTGKTSHWIFYGTAGPQDEDVLFFDQAGIKRTPDKHILVWVKGLSGEKLTAILSKAATAQNKAQDIDPGLEAAIATASYRQAGNERLLVESAGLHLTDEQRVGVMALEAIANSSMVSPHSRSLLEIDCAQDRSRFLCTTVLKPDGSIETSDNMTTGWAYTAPETLGSTLAALVCPAQSH